MAFPLLHLPLPSHHLHHLCSARVTSSPASWVPSPNPWCACMFLCERPFTGLSNTGPPVTPVPCTPHGTCSCGRSLLVLDPGQACFRGPRVWLRLDLKGLLSCRTFDADTELVASFPPHSFWTDSAPQFKTVLPRSPSQVRVRHTHTCHCNLSCVRFTRTVPEPRKSPAIQEVSRGGMEGIKEKSKNRRFPSSNTLKGPDNISRK